MQVSVHNFVSFRHRPFRALCTTARLIPSGKDGKKDAEGMNSSIHGVGL